MRLSPWRAFGSYTSHCLQSTFPYSHIIPRQAAFCKKEIAKSVAIGRLVPPGLSGDLFRPAPCMLKSVIGEHGIPREPYTDRHSLCSRFLEAPFQSDAKRFRIRMPVEETGNIRVFPISEMGIVVVTDKSRLNRTKAEKSLRGCPKIIFKAMRSDSGSGCPSRKPVILCVFPISEMGIVVRKGKPARRKEFQGNLKTKQRRERDSNPRRPFKPHTTSNRAPSTTRTSLQAKRTCRRITFKKKRKERDSNPR